MAELTFVPETVNVTAKAGDRVRWFVSVTDDNGDPVDWSGYSFAAQVRVNPWDSGSPVATLAIDETDADQGTVWLTLSKTLSATMLPASAGVSAKSWYWDLQRTSESDAEDVRTTHGGILTLQMDVTR